MAEATKTKTVWLINQDASTPETGYAGRSYYLGRELAKQGYDIYVIAASFSHHLREAPQVNKTVDVEKIDGLSFVRVKVPHYSKASSPMRIVSWFTFAWRLKLLPKYIKDPPCLVIFSSPPLIGYLGAERLATRLGAKLAFEVRDIWPLTLCEIGGYSRTHPFIRFMQWIEDRAYKHADLVISNLRDSYKHMQRRGLDVKKFHWVPNGYLHDEVAAKEPLDPDVTAQLPSGKFIVGYTGAIGRANALMTMVEAADQCRHDDRLAFVIVGQGEEQELIKSEVMRRGLGNVHLIDRIPKRQVQSMLSRFNVCYIGLRKDSLFRFGVSPNKLFDYLYSGKPVLYAIDSGDYSPVEEFSAGLTIEPESPSALVAAVNQLAGKSEQELSEMGGNARRCAMEHYEYSVLAKRLANVIFEK